MGALLWFLVLPGWLPAGMVSVFLPDGSPASGATANSVQTAVYLEVRNGVAVNRYGKPVPELAGDGKFLIPDAELGRFVFLHARGWADEDIGAETREIRLRPWNEVRGQVLPSAGAVSRVTFSRTEKRGGTEEDRGVVYWTSAATVLPDRSFVVGFVPDGRGALGLERSFTVDRRDFRWSECPQEIEIPLADPISLGNPQAVLRGRLPKSTPGPAMVEVTERTGGRLAFFGMADASGEFAIPGLPPGDFRLSARPLDEAQGKYQVQREFNVPAGTRECHLGELPAPHADVEIYRMVEYPDGLIEKVRAEAAGKSRQPIQKIWIGQLAHPLHRWGARVTFVPEPLDETHAVARTWLVQIPVETIRKFYPEFQSQGYGYRFRDGSFSEQRLIEKTVRSFPLRDRTLHLPVEGDLDYNLALALLRAIETKSWKDSPPLSARSASSEWVWGRSAGVSLGPEDLAHIEWLRREKPGGRIEVRTQDGDFSGKSAVFEEKNGEFFLVEGGYWRA